MQLIKSEARKAALALRRNMTSEKKHEADINIMNNVLNLKEFRNANRFFIYVSTPIEVETHSIIKWLFENGKTVAAPKCYGSDMIFKCISSFDSLESGYYGIMEPKDSCLTVEPDETDVCIVPALSYNEAGFRVGYGKGFYDRYLSVHNCFKIGLCYENCIMDFISDKFDIPVDLIVTDRKESRRIYGKQGE